MYRVELKDFIMSFVCESKSSFLMYRVELKDPFLLIF